jgi:serine/threonine-protein kinase
MLDARGRIKILDFGVGALTGWRAEDLAASPTDDGLVVGTVEYMSPEQARGIVVDGRSDLYSLGCVLYHLLTGRVPFPGESKYVCLALRIGGRPEPIGELRPGLPPGLALVVDRLMAPDPAGRYSDARAALAALRALAPPSRRAGGSRPD